MIAGARRALRGLLDLFSSGPLLTLGVVALLIAAWFVLPHAPGGAGFAVAGLIAILLLGDVAVSLRRR